VEYGNVLSTLGVIYFKMADFDHAFTYCSKSMEIFGKNQNMESDHPAIADNYEMLGNLSFMNKKQTAAFNFYLLALDLLKRILPPEHEYIIRVRMSLYQITEVEF
jgi:tetratricopeptide (TPR) repeat protein